MSIDYEDLYSTLYLHGYHSNPHSHHAIAEMLPWCLDNLRFNSCLEIGAAKGAAVEWLRDHGKEATGLEVARTGVEDAKAYGRNVVHGSALSLPFDDKSFDLVWSSDVMEHFAPEDIDQVIREQVRVSRRYVANQIACWGTNKNHWRHLSGGKDLHASILKPEDWQAKFEAQGLRLLHKRKCQNGRDLLVFRKKCQTCSRKR